MDIASQVIEPLCLSLIIPFIRPYVMPVVIYILKSVQNDASIFQKIVPRLPKLLNQIDNTIRSAPANGDSSTVENLQLLVDTISALVLHYPAWDDTYKELVRSLFHYSWFF